MRLVLCLMTVFMSASTLSQTGIPKMSAENGYIEPFKMFDNVYYIGDKWVSSYAIDTSSGLVIIDTLDFPYSKWIPQNLQKLGLGDKAVSYIIVTHGHSDHVGGAEFLQSIYNSKVIMTEKGLELTKKQSEKSKGENKFMPPKVFKFAEDKSEVLLGDTKFTFYITPGHTEGDLSIDFLVKDSGSEYRAFVVGGHGVNFQNPALAKQYFASMKRIKKIAESSPVVTVNLSNHPHKNNLFSNRDRVKEASSNNPFISKDNFFNFVDQQVDLATKEQQKASKPQVN
ncbi:MBL fold metallo-hydrolase [Vibrio coralliilyticus]|uniref:MBL fold metallo-hydrolase n=1 Tax=Vibrio TaxID=662 RepID=UPI000507C2D1|nr:MULTISPECIES: MBL fold metallo-hydrolase [Vibrio]KFI10326.1 beta-lactamase [Vibrio sp. B183]NOI21257.1 MBL fold metallo-hydrolase [Vibrio coralliilyticus]